MDPALPAASAGDEFGAGGAVRPGGAQGFEERLGGVRRGVFVWLAGDRLLPLVGVGVVVDASMLSSPSGFWSSRS
ncbi:MAG: hypothetical protein ACRDPT_14540 [Streptomycetales bacterium]